MAVFITSDLHFGHDKSFLYAPRGFNTIAEHDATVISNWNSMVAPEDIVYVLGDICLNDIENGMKCLSALNGEIKIVRGNHDTDNRWALYSTLPNVSTIGWSEMIKHRKWRFYLSHFKSITSNFDDGRGPKERIWNLCGHSHTSNKWADIELGCIYHCELDSHNNCPVNIETIIEDIKTYWAQKENQECEIS